MARRFSVKRFTVADLNFRLKFESEELHEDGRILDDNLVAELTKALNETVEAHKDALPEALTEEVCMGINLALVHDPLNVYKNMLGDEHQRTKLVSVELIDSEGNETVYEF